MYETERTKYSKVYTPRQVCKLIGIHYQCLMMHVRKSHLQGARRIGSTIWTLTVEDVDYILEQTPWPRSPLANDVWQEEKKGL